VRLLCRLRLHDWGDWHKIVLTVDGPRIGPSPSTRDTDAQERACDSCGYVQRERIFAS
jgi:hypothetical protein